MSEYEEFIGILEKKSQVLREEIEKLVALKRKKIGAGYLTNQGALFLIASDLGISLTKEAVKKDPMEEIKVEKISKEDLDNKSKALRSDKRRRSIKFNMMTPLVLLGIFGVVIVFTNLENTNESSFIFGLIPLLGAIIGTIILIRLPTRFLEKKEIIFLEFFQTYQKISEYKYRDSNVNTGKYENAVDDLAYFIEDWTRSGSPTAISELPDSIRSNLRKKIIPMIKSNDSKKIEQFTNQLEKVVFFSYNEEPTAQLLRAFNEVISEVEIKDTEKAKEEKSPRNLFLKLVWLSPISGIILYFILNYVDPELIHASLGYSVTTAVAVLIIIVTLVKRK